MRKKILLVILSTIMLNSCGKTGPLENPTHQKRPSFDRVFDE